MRVRNIWLSTLLALSCSSPVLSCAFAASAEPEPQYSLRFHWQDEFTATDRTRLQNWIRRTDAALAELIGSLPFTRHVYFYRVDGASEPVPWAHTRRGRQLAVHLYVDPAFSTEAFVEDWTAAHELSHLTLPYLGRRNAWLAEGFASYMQYQVLARLGVVDGSALEAIYRQRFVRADERFELRDLSFVQAVDVLRARRDFPTMYWGGAVFFWQVDHTLREHSETDLLGVLRQYVHCCRRRTRNTQHLFRTLDDIVRLPVFAHTLEVFNTHTGFPEYLNPPQWTPP